MQEKSNRQARKFSYKNPKNTPGYKFFFVSFCFFFKQIFLTKESIKNIL